MDAVPPGHFINSNKYASRLLRHAFSRESLRGVDFPVPIRFPDRYPTYPGAISLNGVIARSIFCWM